jgi:thiamine-phosphate pyrophosphorylase
VQLREKDLPVRELLSLARELRGITREFGAKLFINDRVDVAVAVDADGVHLGGQSMPASAVRKIVGSGMLIGVSKHSINEAREEGAGEADFITFGPIFPTPSKMKYGAPVGVRSLKETKNVFNKPVFAIGGINSGNVSQVMNAGANGVALISAILSSGDIQRAAELMVLRIGEAVNG